MRPAATLLRARGPSLLAVGSAVLAFLAFLPALRCGFVWEDIPNLVQNTAYRSLGLGGLRWMFFTFQLGGVYQPLSWMTHALDHALWGLSPAGHHLTSLLLHSLSAAVLSLAAALVLRMALPVPPGETGFPVAVAGAFAALSWALHPLRVEAVACVSNRSYVLPGLFFLLSFYAYLRSLSGSDGSPRSRAAWAAASLSLFALSLMSKAIAAGAPVMLLALAAYLSREGKAQGSPGGREAWRLPLLFLLLSAAALLLAAYGRMSQDDIASMQRWGWKSRAAQALFAPVFYLEKTILPIGLSPLVLLPGKLGPFDGPCLPRTLVFLALALGIAAGRRRRPAVAAAAVCYLAALSPFLGLVKYGIPDQVVSDRWAYLACLPWSVVGAGALLEAWRRLEGRDGIRRALACACCAWLAVMASLTWRQTGVWRSEESVWAQAVAVDPENPYAHHNLGNALSGLGRREEAVRHYREAIRILPGAIKARYNLAIALMELGRFSEGDEALRGLIAQSPRDAAMMNVLGVAMAQAGRPEAAARWFQDALRVQPGFQAARDNLAQAVLERDRMSPKGR